MVETAALTKIQSWSGRPGDKWIAGEDSRQKSTNKILGYLRKVILGRCRAPQMAKMGCCTDKVEIMVGSCDGGWMNRFSMNSWDERVQVGE